MLAVSIALAVAVQAAGGYPRIANLWGCSPLSTDYDQWARYSLLVMGGGPPEAWRKFRSEVKACNPDLMLLGTAPLMNLGPPKDTPWMKDEWFLRRPDGEKINWWAGQVYVPNLFLDDCLAALLQHTGETYGDLLREGVVDGIFYDSVVGRASWLGEVDTNGDGVADLPAEVDPPWHERQDLFFDRLRERWPGLRILANDMDAGHAPHVHGRLYEGGPLLDRVAAGTLSPADAIKTLNTWMAGSVQPGLTFALMTHPLGWQGWRVGQGNAVTTPGEVDRVRRDFRRMRLGLLTTLMTDAYFAYDFGTVWYGLPFWYAEYDTPLGRPLAPAQEVFDVPPVPVLDWAAGQEADAFVIDLGSRATPAGLEGEVADPQAGWNRLFATDFRKIYLEPGQTYRLEADCEVLRKPTATFQFNVRTATGGWEHHDKGVQHNAGEAGSEWRIEVTIVPDDFEDYAVEWHLLGAGALRLKSLKIFRVGESYFLREFEGGLAVLNSSPAPLTVRLPRPLRHLADEAAPRHVVEVDDGSNGFSGEGAWEILDGEAHYYGTTYRLAPKPGETARWSFMAPSEDTYTLFVCVPGGKNLTDTATYTVRGAEGDRTATIDQRKGDGGWVKLGEVQLSAGQRCEVVLRSGGLGATAADAIRAESAARFHDGTRVESVTLDPLDGTILLNE